MNIAVTIGVTIDVTIHVRIYPDTDGDTNGDINSDINNYLSSVPVSRTLRAPGRANVHPWVPPGRASARQGGPWALSSISPALWRTLLFSAEWLHARQSDSTPGKVTLRRGKVTLCWAR
jgi:hypothetical protein